MKYFIVSDIHGFYDELIEALNEKGYDKNNPSHTLIINGDFFDRGNKPLEIYEFIESIPKSNRILIRGNHEDIFLDLLNNFYPEYTDFINQTVKTFCIIAGKVGKEYLHHMNTFRIDFENPNEKAILLWQQVKKEVSNSNIAKLIKSDELLDYYELDKYIITHGFIPLKEKGIYLTYYPEWRNENSKKIWSNARWNIANHYFQEGYFDEEIKNNKVLVVGHVFASYFHSDFEGDTNSSNNSIYYGDNLIAIDGATIISHKVNVLVIENNQIIK